MHFTKVFAAALAVAAPASAAAIQRRGMTAQQTVNLIEAITKQSQQLEPVVSDLQTGDSVIAKRQSSSFTKVIQGYAGLVNTATNDASTLSDDPTTYSEADAKKFCTAYTNFAVINEELLQVTASKSGVVESLLLPPMATVLNSYENAVDSLSFAIIGKAPNCEADATEAKEALDKAFKKAKCAYTPGGSLGIDVLC